MYWKMIKLVTLMVLVYFVFCQANMNYNLFFVFTFRFTKHVTHNVDNITNLQLKKTNKLKVG